MRTGVIAAFVAIASIMSGNLSGFAAAADAPALYTAAQAEEGAYLFTHKCAECHGSRMEGLSATGLKGEDFQRVVARRNHTVWSLLNFITINMPRYKPGSLTPAQYSQVTAFILQQNGYPAGPTALSADTPNIRDVKLGLQAPP